MAELPSRTLVVVGQKVLHEGTNKNGDAYTLYEVFATTPDGEQVEEDLRSFDEFKKGEPVEYKLKRQDSEQYGVSYTLYAPGQGGGKGGSGSRLGPKVDDLRDRVVKLEAEVGRIRGLLGDTGQAEVPATSGTESRHKANAGDGPTSPAPATSDDDIPF